ncbi:MFS transporter [Pullulanibacillus sp. KACC 23026]|uniref:MDR family MFS transporter n=1 Tax=Pullulanibacillus sp. KACC 23026 TaxID=3028315 RepID=UPI0023B1895D|nr:MFS transporter [Pullulanibacillus sp. KACC 23026]WEG14556.1 MFS transporter [Pullulanibacillus sp. KACC 23026]
MELGKLHPNVQVRLLDVTLNSLSSSMYVPFMAIYFSERWGAVITGLLLVITVLIGFIGGLYAGYLADSIGRKSILTIASFVKVVGALLFVLVNSPFWHSTIVTFIAFLIVSVSGAIAEPIAEAMVMDVTTNDERPEVYNLMYWLTNLSVVLGSFIGGAFFQNHFFAILLVSMAISILSVLVILFLISDTYQKKNESRVNGWNLVKGVGTHYKKVSKDSTFMVFTFATLLFFTLEFQTTNYIGVRLSKQLPLQTVFSLGDLHLKVDGTSMVGWLNAENTIIVAAMTLFIGKVIKPFNRLKVLSAGLVLYTAGFFFLGFNNSPILLLLAGFVATLGEIIFWPMRQAYLAECIPKESRSSYMAVNSFVVRGASVLAALFISAGAIAAPLVISCSYAVIGFLSMWLFYVAIQGLKARQSSETS